MLPSPPSVLMFPPESLSVCLLATRHWQPVGEKRGDFRFSRCSSTHGTADFEGEASCERRLDVRRQAVFHGDNPRDIAQGGT
jgi:hypothetical protein